MNGFIYFEAGNRHLEPRASRFTRFGVGTPVEEKSFTCGDKLLTWGHPAGDVHISLRGNETLLILCGYVSEIGGGPIFIGQEQATDYLLESIESDSSTAALATLLDHIHGSFSIFYRNLRKGISLCLADRIASRPLWKMWDGTGWVISTHANAIASAVPSTKADLGALGAFLLYGGPVEPRKSLFAGVTAIPPGSVVMLGKAGALNESRWYQFRHQADNSRSLSDWIELAAERLVCSASRIAAQCARPVVFFSGGVDSRLTAVALKAAGANPLLVTLGDARNLEVRVSEQAARAMGLEHVIILRDKHWYLRALPKLVPETNGSFLWTHGHFSQAVHQLRGQSDVNVFLLGDFCEAFSKLFCMVEQTRRDPWTPEEFVRDFDRIRLPLYRPGNRNRTLSLLRQGIRAEIEASLYHDMVTNYRNLAAVSVDPWIVGDQCFRWGTAATLPTFFMFHDLRRAAAERNLMFDKDVHDLLETFPSRVRNGANFGARLISRLDPRAGRALNSNSLLPMSWPPVMHKLSKKCKPVLGKVRRFAFGSTHRTTGAWPEKAALYVSDPLWRDYIEKTLEGDALFVDGFFDRDRVRQCWSALVNGDREVAGDIEKLLQLGLLSELRHPSPECAGLETAVLQ